MVDDGFVLLVEKRASRWVDGALFLILARRRRRRFAGVFLVLKQPLCQSYERIQTYNVERGSVVLLLPVKGRMQLMERHVKTCEPITKQEPNLPVRNDISSYVTPLSPKVLHCNVRVGTKPPFDSVISCQKLQVERSMGLPVYIECSYIQCWMLKKTGATYKPNAGSRHAYICD